MSVKFCARGSPQCGPGHLTLAGKQFGPQLTNAQPCHRRNDPAPRAVPPLPRRPRTVAALFPHCLRASRVLPSRPLAFQRRARLAPPRPASGADAGGLGPCSLHCAPLPRKRWALNDRCLGARCWPLGESAEWKDSGRTAQVPFGTSTSPLFILPNSIEPAFSAPSRCPLLHSFQGSGEARGGVGRPRCWACECSGQMLTLPRPHASL